MITYKLSDWGEMKYKIVKYKNINGNCPFDNFIKYLLKQNKKEDLLRVQHSINLLQEFGNNLVLQYPKMVKYLKEGIYELRPGRNRILYFHYNEDDEEYVILHGFIKSTQKTPSSELSKALIEKKDYERNFNYETRKPFQHS